MKTQIIPINRNDDFISIRDKMGWGRTQRILLIWSDHHPVLKSQLEFNLLQRYACRSGAHLGIVTFDEEVQALAGQAGIAVFSDLSDAQNTIWEAELKSSPAIQHRVSRMELYRLRDQVHPKLAVQREQRAFRFIPLLTSIFAILTLGFVILPKAEITVIPKTKTQSMMFSIISPLSEQTVNPTPGMLPAEIREVVIEGEKSMETTGSTTIPDHAAHGEIQIMNVSELALTLPTQMIIETAGENPIKFIIKLNNPLIIEPGKPILLTAQAIESGSSGNLPPDSLVVYNGIMNQDLEVTNPAETNGGTDAPVPSPAPEDIHILKDSLAEELKQSALSKLSTLLSPGDALITPTVKLVETVQESTHPAIGEPGKHVTLHLQLRFQTLVLTQAVLKRFASPVMDANITPGYVPVIGSIVVSTGVNDQDTIVRVKVDRTLRAVIATDNILNQIKGESVSTAARKIKTSDQMVDAVDCKLIPGWWPWLPYLTMRMSLVNH